MLRKIKWEVQQQLITKNGVAPLTTSLFRKFNLSIKDPSLFNVPTTQMSIFILS